MIFEKRWLAVLAYSCGGLRIWTAAEITASVVFASLSVVIVILVVADSRSSHQKALCYTVSRHLEYLDVLRLTVNKIQLLLTNTLLVVSGALKLLHRRSTGAQNEGLPRTVKMSSSREPILQPEVAAKDRRDIESNRNYHQPERSDSAFKIVLLGEGGVGKSALVRKVRRSRLQRMPLTCIGAAFSLP